MFADNPKHIIHLFFIIIYVREILTEQCGKLINGSSQFFKCEWSIILSVILPVGD